MRRSWWIATVAAASALVLPALAQQPAGQPNANSFFTGADPRKLNFTKVNPSGAMKVNSPTNTLQPSAAARTGNSFKTGSVFPRVTLGSWPPKLPTFGVVKTPAAPTPQTTKVNGGSVNLFKLN